MSDGKRKLGSLAWTLIVGEIVIVLMVLNWFLSQDKDAPAPEPEPAVTGQSAVDAPAPAEAQAEAEIPAPPAFDVVRVDPAGKTLIAGRAEPGSAVVLLVEGDEVARAEAGGDGSFSLFAELPPADVPRALSLRMELADGRTIASGATVFLAPTSAPAPPAPVASAAEPPAPEPLAPEPPAAELAEVPPPAAPEPAPPEPAPPRAPEILLSDAAGVRVLQAPEGDLPPGRAGVLIEAIAYEADGAVALSGRGQAGGALRLYLDNAAIAGGLIDASGRWAQRLDSVAPGLYTLRADLLNPDGSVSARFETPFRREPPEEIAARASVAAPDGQAEARVITVQPGFTLWGIADRTYGSGFQYVKIFSANRAQIRDPDLIYPGQVFTLPE
ncbi:LysM peptidoglycan-binding domain-containing protein [Rhodovulum tesquicola]|uniref:LysM peptidoglycan-binding domain-containing protein n=1 Tax=Rhodovulum tesquicola TaxID=540254 RepID=UPI002097FCF0|nr:LysM peptidoglycan-binding domain-containing protein [Rhodovulum tesquicola]MCO8145358.1 LysM peptidoglycan-binding domain-containing protein [Rhodovulum tesquicola]